MYAAFGTEAANAWARIHALVAIACLGSITFVVGQALWAATVIRIAEMFWYTVAYSQTEVVSAFSILTAW